MACQSATIATTIVSWYDETFLQQAFYYSARQTRLVVAVVRRQVMVMVDDRQRADRHSRHYIDTFLPHQTDSSLSPKVDTAHAGASRL